MNQTELKTIDLFAGVGGIRLGFERAGFKTIFANDFDKTCKLTYDLNFDTPKLNTEDIWKVDINKLPEFDILTEGFPCQAFSIAGYRKGFDEDKVGGNLFFRFAKKLNIESSVITHALKKLENEGLIHAYRKKKLKYYEINDKNTINTLFLNLDKLNNKKG